MSSEKIKIDPSVVALQRLVVPEISELIESRYNIITAIKTEEPIGRRNLAYVLGMSERHVRTEIDFLEQGKLVKVERQGVVLTAAGREMIGKLEQMLYAYNGLEYLERELKEKLSLKAVFVSPGDMDINYQVQNFMGRSAADYLLSILSPQATIALTGGSSTAALTEQMKEGDYPEVFVIPARGGIGKSHDTQANNVVAEMGIKLHANYELLHLPDNIDQRLLEALKDYPEVKRVFKKMEHIDVFIFGIGRADALADWRNMRAGDKKELLDNGAVGESFGHYFDVTGKSVSPSSTIGVSVDNYRRIPYRIAISGGASKAQAIAGVCRIAPDTVLVTDESAAKAILEMD